MREHDINKLDNFMGGWYMDPSICDKIIDYHKSSPYRYQGITGEGYNSEVKESIDVIVQTNPELAKEYLVNNLQQCLELYIEKYPWCNAYEPWMVTEGVNIQYYPKGGGFKTWHTERTLPELPYNNRHLVFMTYLNDVTDDGETEFYHQKLKIKPEKGLTIIWPTDWTFTHRGIPSDTQEKYIITGWYSFIKKED
jgi:hypothetical protein